LAELDVYLLAQKKVFEVDCSQRSMPMRENRPRAVGMFHRIQAGGLSASSVSGKVTD
jgi:hypothetical protein